MRNQQSKHDLTALKGGHPLGALAAFGLLRVCTAMSGMAEVRLGWDESDLTASLSIRPALTDDELIARLSEAQVGRTSAPEFGWAEDIRTDPKNFVKGVSEARGDTRALSFLSAFGSEFVMDGKRNLKPSALHMMSGQQRFLRQARELAASLEPLKRATRGKAQSRSAGESFREALFGPWQYRDEFHAFGWDPDAERLHALQAKSPTSEKPSSVRAAVWLAVEALPFFPCAIVDGRLRTRGFSRREGKVEFSWPLWQPPLSLDVVRSLLALHELTLARPKLNELRARGIFAVFRARRASLQKGYAIFRAAQPCA